MGTTKRGRQLALLSGLALALLAAILAWVSWGWIRFLLEFEGLGRNAQGYSEFRHRVTEIVFVRLPGGRFDMGSPESELYHSVDEGPVHSVELSPFLIAKYELSQAEWGRVMGDNPSRFRGKDLPVEQVSWKDCKEFCAKTELSLPSEAQWERACRAGTTTPFAFGKTLTDDQANFDTRGTVKVDSFKPNRFGIYNMHGNVYEWCEDVYNREFYSKGGATQKNPVCTSGSEYRTMRGGSWWGNAWFCSSAYRSWGAPSRGSYLVGFRPAARAP